MNEPTFTHHEDWIFDIYDRFGYPRNDVSGAAAAFASPDSPFPIRTFVEALHALEDSHHRWEVRRERGEKDDSTVFGLWTDWLTEQICTLPPASKTDAMQGLDC